MPFPKGQQGYWKGKTRSDETKKKLSLANLGKKYSAEVNKKKGKVGHKKYYDSSGENNPFWKGGKPKCIECGKQLGGYQATRCKSCANKMEKNRFWKGGISFELYPSDWSDKLKDSIRERDDFVCQECGVHQDECDRKLDIHHIDYNKDNCNPDNLISLCRKCHCATNHNREYWVDYFRKEQG